MLKGSQTQEVGLRPPIPKAFVVTLARLIIFESSFPLYSRLAAPLEKFRNVRGVFILGPLMREYFQAFLELIAKAPILSFPNFTLAFYVATYASNVGIAAVLYQLPNDEFVPGQTKYIAFQSRALHDHEKRLSRI